MEGLKYDEGKTRWDLVPELASAEIAKVFTLGAEKYGDLNWCTGYATVVSGPQQGVM